MTEESLLKRQPDEELEDYLRRIYSNMENYGLDKHTAAALLNENTGETYDESKWRKDFAQSEKWLGYYTRRSMDRELIAKYEEIKVEAEKEKIRTQDQRREYKKLIRNQARFEAIRDDIVTAIEGLEKKKPLASTLPPVVNTKKAGLSLFSDWHFGMDIDNFANKFNKEIFNERVGKLLAKTIEHGEKHGISTLHVANLGDLVGGLIHISTRVQANEDVVEQVKYVSETLAEVLAELSNHFHEIKFYNIAGNHGRTHMSKHDVGIKENFEYLIPWYIEARLKDFKNITVVNEQDGFILAKIFDEDVAFTHGHYDRPDQAVTKIPQLTGIIPSYIFSGHIHHHFEKEYGKTICIVNSSLIGNDDYAMQGRFGSKPAQKFLVFDEIDGLECTYNIKFA